MCTLSSNRAPPGGPSTSPLDAAELAWSHQSLLALAHAQMPMVRAMRRLSDGQRRIVAAVVLVMCLVPMANHFLNLGLFGGYDRVLYVASVAILVLGTFFVLPSWRQDVRGSASSNNRWRGP